MGYHGRASCDLRLFLQNNNYEDSYGGDERGDQKKSDERRNRSACDGSCLDCKGVTLVVGAIDGCTSLRCWCAENGRGSRLGERREEKAHICVCVRERSKGGGWSNNTRMHTHFAIVVGRKGCGETSRSRIFQKASKVGCYLRLAYTFHFRRSHRECDFNAINFSSKQATSSLVVRLTAKSLGPG